jgi:hypothetical protein
MAVLFAAPILLLLSSLSAIALLSGHRLLPQDDS